MGAAVISSPKNPTHGWTAVPNSLIENQSLLAPGELRLALIVVRRGGNAISVSDSNWTKWTGLGPRLKEMAMKGLLNKGLQVHGRGEQARFTWDSSTWTRYVTSAPTEKPRTAGRAVEPKPGAKVHQECRERGCAMLRPECGLNLVSSTPIAKPVSQTDTGAGSNSWTVQQSTTNTGGKCLSLIAATSLAKPVSQTVAGMWAKTLAAVESYFPAVGLSFLALLLEVICRMFTSVTDDELASAVHMAARHAGSRLKSAGLFLKTVPDAMYTLRKVPKPPRGPVDAFDPGADFDPGAIDEYRAVAGNPNEPDWRRQKAERFLHHAQLWKSGQD